MASVKHTTPELPYLPDIISGIVSRVNVRTQSLLNPFNVSFDYGIHREVSKDVYSKENQATQAFPLFWLIYDYNEQRGQLGEYGNVTCDIVIACLTKDEYTTKERTDISFKPVLIPAYQIFLEEISKEKKLRNSILSKIEHSRKDMPYWGGGDVNGSNTKNLFRNYVDAIWIKGLKLNIKNNC